MNRPELLVLIAGLALMVIAAAAVDWRGGLFLAGLSLAAVAIDFRPRSRA